MNPVCVETLQVSQINNHDFILSLLVFVQINDDELFYFYYFYLSYSIIIIEQEVIE